ncbi:methyltransferase domain-containing protein [Dactylosporangium sp. NPDC050588]|uniref:class I SAM-dependent methyltransferase n=1 Tax=Dactylosporangium sp. NPDC050588 TaxID=3157211 RepID=UPI0033E95B85
MGDGDRLTALLDEQAAFYQAVASEYDDHALHFAGGDELTERLERAIDDFRPTGRVLELACGPATWTRQLLRHATDLTAVDASAEMLRIAAARVGAAPVRFERADLFSWRPDRRYDVVFFGFWLSHVPAERFAPFWSMVSDCLEPDGRVLFVDDPYRAEEELIEGADSPVIQRRLTDGTPYRILKIPHRPADLERRLEELGWAVTVHANGPFYWGSGGRR